MRERPTGGLGEFGVQRPEVEFFPAAAHEHYYVARRFKFRRVFSEDFADYPAGAVAFHGAADPSAGDHREPRKGPFGRRAQIKDEGGTIRLRRVSFDKLKVFCQAQPVDFAEAHGSLGAYFVTRRLRPFCLRAAITERPPRVCILARHPQRRARFNLEGLYVGFIACVLSL